MRLFDLRDEDILNWQMERLWVGQEKYGDTHMNRNNLVDVMEELLDALNILVLLEDRLERTGDQDSIDVVRLMANENIRPLINTTMLIVRSLEGCLPSHLVTDEAGGKRVWWSEAVREAGDE